MSIIKFLLVNPTIAISFFLSAFGIAISTTLVLAAMTGMQVALEHLFKLIVFTSFWSGVFAISLHDHDR